MVKLGQMVGIILAVVAILIMAAQGARDLNNNNNNNNPTGGAGGAYNPQNIYGTIGGIGGVIPVTTPAGSVFPSLGQPIVVSSGASFNCPIPALSCTITVHPGLPGAPATPINP